MPEPAELRERALRLLARREHSRVELGRKLERTGAERHDIDQLLDAFEAKNWLSDHRFAESYVADHRARSGAIKLAYELRQRGVSSAVIDATLGEIHNSEVERARVVWEKKFGNQPADLAEKGRQARFMHTRGFTSEVIRQVIKAMDDN